jgi:hypothetical protein
VYHGDFGCFALAAPRGLRHQQRADFFLVPHLFLAKIYFLERNEMKIAHLFNFTLENEEGRPLRP